MKIQWTAWKFLWNNYHNRYREVHANVTEIHRKNILSNAYVLPLSSSGSPFFMAIWNKWGYPAKEARTYEGKWLGQLEFLELALLHPHQLYGVRIGIPSSPFSYSASTALPCLGVFLQEAVMSSFLRHLLLPTTNKLNGILTFKVTPVL